MSSEKNIIKVYFKGTHLTHSKTQYQYNHGMILHFADLNLPQAFETHFANKQHGNSKTVIGSENKVEIPDEYFWTGANEIFAWVYLHSDVDDGETVYEVRIPLVKRAKPSDEEPLPEQQSAIDRAIAELGHAVETTNADAEQTNADREAVTALRDEVIDLRDEAEQSAQTATAKANEANESASSASESEQNAHDYADDAKRYAENAFSSKETAVASASDAEQAKEDAEQARDDAQGAKSDAIQIKQDVVGLKDDVVNLKDDVIVLKEQTDTNVTHYPKVIDDYWHVWNASLGEYVNTNVKAKGEKGDKGDTGNSGVYIGEDEPTDDEINVWIDIDDEDVFVGLKYVMDDPSNNYGVIEGGVIADVSHGLYINQATGLASHAEGTGTVASGGYSHSEGGGTIASGDCGHAEGAGTTASGANSHSEGSSSKAIGGCSHAEGAGTKAEGLYSHAEGSSTQASGSSSHSEGVNTKATGMQAHAEGYGTIASGAGSHAECGGTKAVGLNSHAEGEGTEAKGIGSHAEGNSTVAEKSYSHAEGDFTSATGTASHAEGGTTLASGIASHAEGGATKARNNYAHAEGQDTDASGERSHAEGYSSVSSANSSHAEGNYTTASGASAHAEGGGTTASGDCSHAEGAGCTSSGNYSHAEGSGTKAIGSNSHSEGAGTTANGEQSHAEGGGTTASGFGSHAEGGGTMASANYSHAEGGGCTASGMQSHAEGGSTTASGNYSHAEGGGTLASSDYQHVQGKYNIEDDQDTYAFIIGNGASSDERSNALTLDWDGNLNLGGKATVATAPTNDNDVATKKYVDDSIDGVDIPVNDVQINGTSIVSDGVVNIPPATSGTLGLVRMGQGLSVNAGGALFTQYAEPNRIKAESSYYMPITPVYQHVAAFYGLAHAAGDTTQKTSSNAVGTYTEEAKQAIKAMLGIKEDVAEIIADITTEEDLESFIINTDQSSESFKLKFAKIFITYPPSSTGESSYTTVRISGHKMNTDTSNDYSLPTLSVSTTGLKALHFFKTTGGIVEQYSVYDNTAVTKTLSTFRTYNTMDLVDYIYAVKLLQYNNTATIIPAGTHIVIQGIRV